MMQIKSQKSKVMHQAIVVTILVFCFWFLDWSEAAAATIGRPMNNDGLVGYWSFDVPTGDGTYVPDKSGRGNNGTLTNASGTENWTEGKIGGGMVFDGPTVASGDYVDVGTAGDFITATSVTLSAWVNKQGDIAGVTGGAGGIVGTMSGHGGYQGDVFVLEVADSDEGGNERKYITQNSNLSDTQLLSNATVPDNTWTHVTFTYDGSTKKIYLNGVLDVSEPATGSISSSTLSFVDVQIGHQRGFGNGENYMNGILDEVRIYNRALSAYEIKRLYNFSAPKLGKTPTVIADGLVGHWTFDGRTVTGSNVFDLSGQDNTGTIVSDPVRSAGNLGQALAFETDDCITYDDAPAFRLADEYTLSAWVKTTATFSGYERIQGVYSLANPRDIDINFWTDNIPHLYDRDDNANAKSVSSNQTINDGLWHLVTGTRNGNLYTMYIDGEYANSLNQSGNVADTNTRGWAIGCAGRDNTTVGQFLDGSLDDVRIYNRTLSVDEVARLFNGTRPSTAAKPELSDGLVGYWGFDFPTDGTTVYDRSGNNNDGTLTNATGTSNWVDGVAGGGAMELDGYNDNVTMGNILGTTVTAEVTLSAWVKRYGISSGGSFNDHGVVGKTSSGVADQYVLEIGSGIGCCGIPADKIEFGTDTLSDISLYSNSTLDLNEWQHIAATYDGSIKRIYIDGVLDAEEPATGTFTDSGAPVDIGWTHGHGNGNHVLNGVVDEVRIYNRALSAEEIRRLYQMGL